MLQHWGVFHLGFAPTYGSKLALIRKIVAIRVVHLLGSDGWANVIITAPC